MDKKSNKALVVIDIQNDITAATRTFKPGSCSTSDCNTSYDLKKLPEMREQRL